jgi:hypothetical protein
LSVLNAGKEATMKDEDVGLEQNWSPFTVINHTVTMTSLAFERLAEYDKKIIFLHSSPGWVGTDIFSRLNAPESSGIGWRMLLTLIQGIVAVSHKIVGTSVTECGERQAFNLTTDKYSPGAWRVDPSSDQISAQGVLGQYRDRGWPEKIWEHTVRISDKALTRGET